MARTARDEAAHRVADEHDLLDRYWPLVHGLLEQRREAPSVVRDVEARVVAQVERRVAQVVLEPRAVWAAAEQRPRVIGLAQAVDEHRDVWRTTLAAQRHVER